MEPKRKVHEFANSQALMDQLRRLPTPDVPEGLEERLIAGIPRPVPAMPQSAKWKGLAILSAVAAAALLMVLLSTFNHSRKDTDAGATDDSRDVAGAWPTRSFDPKETDL